MIRAAQFLFFQKSYAPQFWGARGGGVKNLKKNLNYFFLAHLCLCTVGSYASLSVCLSVCDFTKIQTGQKVTRPKFNTCVCWVHTTFCAFTKMQVAWLQVSNYKLRICKWQVHEYFAGGLTSTSSCIFLYLCPKLKTVSPREHNFSEKKKKNLSCPNDEIYQSCLLAFIPFRAKVDSRSFCAHIVLAMIQGDKGNMLNIQIQESY